MSDNKKRPSKEDVLKKVESELKKADEAYNKIHKFTNKILSELEITAQAKTLLHMARAAVGNYLYLTAGVAHQAHKAGVKTFDQVMERSILKLEDTLSRVVDHEFQGLGVRIVELVPEDQLPKKLPTGGGSSSNN